MSRRKGKAKGPIASASIPASKSPLSKPLSDDNSSRRLRCLIEGEDAVFTVTVTGESDINDLKELVHEKGINISEQHVLAKELVLLKVATAYSPMFLLWLNFLCFFRSISISVVIMETPLAGSGSKMMT
jgi:hypothetical protein